MNSNGYEYGNISNVFKSLSKSFKSASSDQKAKSLPVNPTIVGTKAFKEDEIMQILRNGAVGEKIRAIGNLDQSISKVSVSSIPEIWYKVKNYCAPNITNGNLRRATIKFLITCIKLSDHSTGTQILYYNDIIMGCVINEKSNLLDENFDLFIVALDFLTEGGRNIYGLILSENHFDDLLLSIVRILKYKMSKESIDQLVTSTVEYIENCITFNYNVFPQSKLVKIILEVIETASLISEPNCLTAVLNFINTAAINGVIESSMLSSVVVLNASSRRLDDEKIAVASQKLFKTLMSSPLAYPYFIRLCQVVGLSEEVLTSSPNVKAIIGSLILMRSCIPETDSNHGFLVGAISFFSKSLKSCLVLQNTQIFIAVANTVHMILVERATLRPFQWCDDFVSVCVELLKHYAIDPSDYSFALVCQNILDECVALNTSGEFIQVAPVIIETFEKTAAVSPPSYHNMQFIIDHYINEGIFLPITEGWSTNLETFVDRFYKGTNKSQVIELLCENFYEFISISDNIDDLSKYVQLVSPSVFAGELDPDSALKIQHFISNTLLLLNDEIFALMIDTYVTIVLGDYKSNLLIAKCLVMLMLRAVRHPQHSEKAIYLYGSIMGMLEETVHSIEKVETCLVFSRLLFRLRADSSRQLFFIQISDANGLCETLGRNLNLIENETQKQHLINSAKWYYPENLDYLPESEMVGDNKCIDTSDIDISRWFRFVLDVIKNYFNWEIYSYAIGHFCPQLSVSNLFFSEVNYPMIHELVSLICQNLHSKSFEYANKPHSITIEDIQVAYIRTLSSIPAYKSCLNKNVQDQIIGAVISALQSWNKTAIPCIHFLNISCYEFGESIKKYLIPILTVLQTKISRPYTGAHILDFIVSLAQNPSLNTTYTVDEFKRIFGISFKYIQYCNQMRDEAISADPLQRDLGNFDFQTSTQHNQLTVQFLNYLKALSYRVISHWFLKMSLTQRRTLSGFIVKNLLLPSIQKAKGKVDELNIATIDFLTRFTFSELDTTILQPSDASDLENNPMYITEKWIYGLSLVTIYTHKLNGHSEIVIRRPTTLTCYSFHIQEEMFPDWLYRMQNSHYEDLPVIFTPSFVMLQLISPVSEVKTLKPEPLLDNSIIQRSTANLDRIPTVYYQKTGILYVAPGQSKEEEILANRFGSRHYHSFLTELGSVIKLKDNKSCYTGGLDIHNDTDGEYAISYTSEIQHLIFHTTTMMPNNADDPNYSMKKRHIGNNYVNVYWDESGYSFDFDKISSQFNFINIVITPTYINNDAPDTNCYRVKIYRAAGVPALFSVCHFKLISENHLPIFIRNTCYLANQLSDAWNTPNFEFNWTRRIKQLTLIKEKNSAFLKTEAEERSIELGLGLEGQDPSSNITIHPVTSAEEIEARGNVNSAKNDVQFSFMDQLNKLDIGGKTSSNLVPISEVDSHTKSFYEPIPEGEADIYKSLEFNSFT